MDTARHPACSPEHSLLDMLFTFVSSFRNFSALILLTA